MRNNIKKTLTVQRIQGGREEALLAVPALSIGVWDWYSIGQDALEMSGVRSTFRVCACAHVCVLLRHGPFRVTPQCPAAQAKDPSWLMPGAATVVSAYPRAGRRVSAKVRPEDVSRVPAFREIARNRR